MKIITTNTIGRYGYPIKEIYNSKNVLVYEAHDEIECEFFSIDMLETMEKNFEIQKEDITEISLILSNAWKTWANLDNENKLFCTDKFQQLVKLFRDLESEDRYLFIQEVVALLGKGVNRYGEKMRAMEELLEEKLDEILLYQGRGKPNVESLKKGFDQLKNELARFCEKKGININDPEFKEILAVTLNEDHMCIFKQIRKQ